MLRLTRESADGSPVIRLEGDLNHEVVDLVRHECRPRKGAPEGGGTVRLDLRELGRADQAGLMLLRELKGRQDIQLLNCSSLLHVLINGHGGKP